MKKKIILFSSIGGAILIAAIVLIICLCLPKSSTYRTIKLFDYSGTVVIKRGSNEIDATKDMKLKNDDSLTTKASSEAILKLDSDKYIMVKENTTLTLKATGKSNNTKTRLLVSEGGIIVEVKEKLKEKESFEIASSNSVMAIRGTSLYFGVKVTELETTTELNVLEGLTNVMFVKDNTLNKTILPGNTAMVYTTKNDETTDVNKVIQLLDRNENVKDVSDDELKDDLKVVRRELTSAEIDQIVDSINEFERKEEEKVNGVIKFSNRPDSVQYGIDPSTVITTDKDYGSIDFYYSLTEDGEFNLTFDELNPFELGDIYFKALGPDAYRSDIFKLSITTRNMSLEILGNQKSSYGTATMNFELDKYSEIFAKDFAKELAEANGDSKYKYYIKITASDSMDNEVLIIDYDHKKVMMPSVYSAIDTINLVVEYHLPNYYNVTSDTDYSFELQKVTNLDTLIVCGDRNTTEGTQGVYLFCEEYFVGDSNSDKLKMYLKDVDAEQHVSYLEVDPTDNYGMFYYESSTEDLEIAVSSFEYDGTNKNKGFKEFEIDLYKSTQDSGTNITDYGDYMITFNEDDTMNAYFDASFTSISNSVKYLSYIYSTSTVRDIRVHDNAYMSGLACGSNQQYLVFEDLIQGEYFFSFNAAITEYNDVYYTVRRGVGSTYIIRPITANSSLATLVADEPEVKTTISSGYDCFDTTKDIILKDYSGNYSFTVPAAAISGNSFSNFVINEYYSHLYMDATIYSQFGLDGFDVTGDYLTNDIFDSVKAQFKTDYGVTIKGSNTTTVTGYMVQGV